MRHFSSTELTRMRSAQDGAMQDVCRIGVYRESTDGYGNPDTTSPEDLWVYGEEQICGMEHVRPQEAQGTGEVPVIDARIRLPVDTEIDERNRIRVKERYNEDLDEAQVFEIEGPVRRGPSGLVVECRLVDDGSGRPWE